MASKRHVPQNDIIDGYRREHSSIFFKCVLAFLFLFNPPRPLASERLDPELNVKNPPIPINGEGYNPFPTLPRCLGSRNS